VPEDPGLERWLRLEAHRLNEALVTQPKVLSDLLREAEPKAATRGGGQHRFDPAALRAMAAELSPLTRHRLRLPITFVLAHDAPGDCHCTGEDAEEALHELNVTKARSRDGKLWLSTPLAFELARRFPGCVQFVRL